MTYSVSRPNRNELVYTEDDRSVRVEVESGFEQPIEGPVGPQHLNLINLVVYVSALRQWEDGTPITSDERQRIGRNISEALTKTRTKHILD